MAKKAVEKVEKSSFEEQLESLNKKYGKNTVLSFKGNEIEKYDVIPTGSIGIDYRVLQIGGVAKSKMYTLKGWQGSNKSTICAHIAANCQKQGGKIVYVDSERAMDKQYFSQLGVVFDDTFILCQPDYGEMGFDVALQLMNSGEIDLVIFDSDSALLGKAMMEGEIGAQTIGKKAKLNSETYPKIKVAASKNNVCVISIAQYRVNPGQMFGDNRVIPGGFALEYYSDCVIDLTKSLKKEGDETSGTITTVKTSKNKMGAPYKNYKVSTIFGFGIDKIEELVDLATEYEIIKKWGSKITLLDNGAGGETKYEEEEFKKLLIDNDDFYKDLKNQIIKKIENV